MHELMLTRESFVDLTEAVLRKRGLLVFRARGSSMVPAVADGDMVAVEHALAQDLSVGDIAMFRGTLGGMIVHRIVGKLKRRTHLFFVTSGDASLCTELIPAELLAGRVVTVMESTGERVSSTEHRNVLYLVRRLIGRCRKPAHQVMHRARCIAGFLVRALQNRPWYRRSLRILVYRDLAVESLSDQPPADCNGVIGSTEPGTGECPPLAPGDSEISGRTTGIRIIAYCAGSVVGSLLIRRLQSAQVEPDRWWVSYVAVRPLVRGGGIGEALMQEAQRLVRSTGGGIIALAVGQDDRRAKALCVKLGFRPVERESDIAPTGAACDEGCAVLVRPV